MVAAAGPAMNLLLFLVIATLLGVLIGTGAIHLEEVGFGKNVAYFLVNGAMLNLLLLAFNLLPVPPLDGWRILEGVSFKARMLTNHPNAPIAGLFFLMAIFLTGAFDWFVVAANYAAMNWAAMVAGMFAG
jgi:Zn-dependent protease